MDNIANGDAERMDDGEPNSSNHDILELCYNDDDSNDAVLEMLENMTVREMSSTLAAVPHKPNPTVTEQQQQQPPQQQFETTSAPPSSPQPTLIKYQHVMPFIVRKPLYAHETIAIIDIQFGMFAGTPIPMEYTILRFDIATGNIIDTLHGLVQSPLPWIQLSSKDHEQNIIISHRWTGLRWGQTFPRASYIPERQLYLLLVGLQAQGNRFLVRGAQKMEYLRNCGIRDDMILPFLQRFRDDIGYCNFHIVGKATCKRRCAMTNAYFMYNHVIQHVKNVIHAYGI